MCPDGLGDGAGVAEAVGVDGSDDEEVNGVGVKPHHRVPLLPHVVGHRLPGAAHRLAVFQKQPWKTNMSSATRWRVCVQIWSVSNSLIKIRSFIVFSSNRRPSSSFDWLPVKDKSDKI